MTDDPMTDRLVKEIGLRSFADRYLDTSEEGEVLRIAEQLGMDRGSAETVIASFCREGGTVRERTVRDVMRAKLSAHPDKLDRPAFDALAEAGQISAGGALTIRDAQRMAIAVMEEAGRTRVRHGWFRNWFTELKRELGVA